MSICIQTPFSYRVVMLNVYDSAYVAFADMTARPKDLQARMRGINSVLVLIYASMTCDFQHQCADLVSGVVSLWHHYTQWAIKNGVNFDIDSDMKTQDVDKAVFLNCCAATDALDFDNICRTYHLSPSKPLTQEPATCVPQEQRVQLPWLGTPIHARLTEILRTMYANHVCTQIHAALDQGVLMCKLPLTSPLSATCMMENNAWEDAAMLVMISSDDNTLANVLKCWPMDDVCPHQHARKLVHFRALLQCNHPITDVDGVVHALYRNDDYLRTFYFGWCREHIQLFFSGVKIDSLAQLQALYRVMGCSNDLFVRFAIAHLVVASAEFKTMLTFLCKLPDTVLGAHDTKNMFALDPHTVQTLLTLNTV